MRWMYAAAVCAALTMGCDDGGAAADDAEGMGGAGGAGGVGGAGGMGGAGGAGGMGGGDPETRALSAGEGRTEVANLLDCQGGRPAVLGTVTASDGSTWTVPAATAIEDDGFPIAPDLHNPCGGARHADAAAALAAFDPADVVEVDPDGALFTGYIFADNYFELFVDGTPVARDPVPFTPFNSNIVRFRASRPFTVAMRLVDWEEVPGLGVESRGNGFHPGDGGLVMALRDESDAPVAVTGPDWKARTVYTAPIADPSCLEEHDGARRSDACSTADAADFSDHSAAHWAVPAGWTAPDFDDSGWPAATTYADAAIGVDNKPAYTDFVDVFDDARADARFIWSTNVVLDNHVLVRFTVE